MAFSLVEGQEDPAPAHAGDSTAVLCGALEVHHRVTPSGGLSFSTLRSTTRAPSEAFERLFEISNVVETVNLSQWAIGERGSRKPLHNKQRHAALLGPVNEIYSPT